MLAYRSPVRAAHSVSTSMRSQSSMCRVSIRQRRKVRCWS